MTDASLHTIAPHCVVGLAGPALTDEERSILSRYPVAGVILFDRNVAGARALMELTQDIRRVFRDSRGAVPVIAADHEGGIISVLARAIGVPPTQMAAARTGKAELCERLFAENARRLRSCGVNMLLGPVADVNSESRNPVIGSRSFGEDVSLVSNLTAVAVSAARREGVLTCLKHFPGHGATAVDSHLAFVTLAATVDELRKSDVRPFARGAAAGAESVMMGHVAPRDRSLPASLDPEIIGGLLRRELGFDGVVMTDALEMEGARAVARSLPEVCRLSLEAGCDVLLFSKPAVEVFEALRSPGSDAPAEGLWSEEWSGAADVSAARVRRLIEAAAAREREFELPGDSSVYGEIARRSIRLIGDFAGADFPSGAFKAVFHAERGEFERFPVRRFIARSLRSLGAAERPDGPREGEAAGAPPGLESRVFPGAAGPEAPADAVFFLNRRPLDGETIARLSAGARLVVVAGWPYAADLLPPGARAVVTYGLYDAAADLLGVEIAK